MKAFRLIAVGAALAASLVSGAVRAQGTELKVSMWVPPNHFLVRDFMHGWAADVEKATNKRVRFQFLPKMVTNPIGHFDAVKEGLADLVFISHSYTPARFPLTRFAVLPFGGNDAEISSVAVWRTYEKYLAKAKEHEGTILLAIYNHGPGIIFNSKRPINSLADLAGLKIRVGGGMAADVGAAIGVTTVMRPAPESYELMAQGVVDGVFFPAESPVSFKLEKLIKYATEFPGGLYSDSHAVLMNPAAFNRLSKDDQAIIMKLSGDSMARRAGKAWNAAGEIGYKAMREAKVQIAKANPKLVKEVREKTEKFESEWIADVNARGIDGEAVLKAFREELKRAGK